MGCRKQTRPKLKFSPFKIPILNSQILQVKQTNKQKWWFFLNLLRKCCFLKQRTFPTHHNTPRSWVSRESYLWYQQGSFNQEDIIQNQETFNDILDKHCGSKLAPSPMQHKLTGKIPNSFSWEVWKSRRCSAETFTLLYSTSTCIWTQPARRMTFY